MSWVVVLSPGINPAARTNDDRHAKPQVIGDFDSEAQAIEWINETWRSLPTWALSTAQVEPGIRDAQPWPNARERRERGEI